MQEQQTTQQAPATVTTGEEQALLRQIVEDTVAREIARDHSRREKETRAGIPFGLNGIEIKDVDQLYMIAGMVFRGGWAPKGLSSAEACFLAMSKGRELGLSLFESLASIAPINGRPSIWGDAMLGLCMKSGLLEDYQVEWSGKRYEDNFGCTVRVKRKGLASPFEVTWDVATAKQAKLWKKAGPWTEYPDRMIEMRARGFVLRNAFPDILRGLVSVEEAMDTPTDDGPGGGGGAAPFDPSKTDVLDQLAALHGGGEHSNGESTLTVIDEAPDVTAELVDSIDPKVKEPSESMSDWSEPADPEPGDDGPATAKPKAAEKSDAKISRSDAQRLTFLSTKVFEGCTKDTVCQFLQRMDWSWNGGRVDYPIQKLSDIPALDGMEMVRELETMNAELAASEGGA